MVDHNQLDRRTESELILGIVAPVGTPLNPVEERLRNRLKHFRYECNVVRMSQLIKASQDHSGATVRDEPEYDRLVSYMDAGNALRKTMGDGGALAVYAIASIRRYRAQKQGPDSIGPLARYAHVLRTLKHRGEVERLRRVYGPTFFLIGVYANRDRRRKYLVEEKGIPEELARQIIERDEFETDEFGQQTRETFHLADIFVEPETEHKDDDLWRFLDLIFGNPHRSPRREEHGMFLAYSAALRSASLSRQVGAVITSEHGDVLAMGANDVARFGGGLYWPGPGDKRDFVLGTDPNDLRKNEIVLAVMKEIHARSSEAPPLDETTLIKEGRKLLENTGVLDITEFGRDVHAEMEALLSCARAGTSPRNGILYTTTFPCHNCAKHIVAAGLKRVVYIEPYPKSRAPELYGDSISIENPADDRVNFEPFLGIGPRRYFDLFSMNLSSGYSIKRKVAGSRSEWDRSTAIVRRPLEPISYLEEEKLVTEFLKTTTEPGPSGTTEGEQ